MRSTVQTLAGILICAAMLVCLTDNGAAEGQAVRIGYVKWSDAIAASNVVKAVLEQEMGRRCILVPLQAEEVWLATASRDIDGFVCAWLPSLHQNYYGKVGSHVLDLGPNLRGTRVGLVVPEYVSISSIDQLQEHALRFGGKIVGIDPGAGIMRLTRKALAEYGIEGMELVSGSGAAMTRTLEEKIANHEWVVVTGWTPHWKFARWDLKYLRDPRAVYGGPEAIHSVVRRGLLKDMPRVYRFLDRFSWSPDDIHRVMQMIQESGDPYASAAGWVEENPTRVRAWIPK